jgi:hypothetical protein
VIFLYIHSHKRRSMRIDIEIYQEGPSAKFRAHRALRTPVTLYCPTTQVSEWERGRLKDRVGHSVLRRYRGDKYLTNATKIGEIACLLGYGVSWINFPYKGETEMRFLVFSGRGKIPTLSIPCM